MYFDFDSFDSFGGGRGDFTVEGHHTVGEFGPGEQGDNGDRASDVAEWCQHFGGDDCNYATFDCGSKGLGNLWAAIQTELLTYRRRQDGDPWYADRFSMNIVRDVVEKGDGFLDLSLVRGEMMKSFCKCGRFEDALNPAIPTTDEACAFRFSNLEDCSGAAFSECHISGKAVISES
ncbi:hypothetical protein HD806DRAFT_541272 [Xylariaceae sp. AK1471]|nr:hypothetical protein HD806DRAFT_541272 [Xylariaceae sp. AK1471]